MVYILPFRSFFILGITHYPFWVVSIFFAVFKSKKTPLIKRGVLCLYVRSLPSNLELGITLYNEIFNSLHMAIIIPISKPPR